jgi:hypothetical protein
MASLGSAINDEDASMAGTEITGEVSVVPEIDLDGIVDEDVQLLGKNLHGAFREILSSSIDQMHGVKQRMLDDKENALRDRDSFYMAQLARQQEIIDGLTEKLAVTETKLELELDRLEAISENAADCFFKKHNEYSGDRSINKVYTAWKDIAFENNRSRQLEHVAHGLYQKGLKSKAFSALVRLFARNAIQREKNKAVAEHELVTRKIIEKYEVNLAKSRAENAEAHRVAGMEQLRRQQLEEDLRRTFLKNMTNMNMEALQLFSHQKPAAPGPENNEATPRSAGPPVPESK